MNKHDLHGSNLKKSDEKYVPFGLILVYAVILLFSFWAGLCIADFIKETIL